MKNLSFALCFVLVCFVWHAQSGFAQDLRLQLYNELQLNLAEQLELDRSYNDDEKFRADLIKLIRDVRIDSAAIKAEKARVDLAAKAFLDNIQPEVDVTNKMSKDDDDRRIAIRKIADELSVLVARHKAGKEEKGDLEKATVLGKKFDELEVVINATTKQLNALRRSLRDRSRVAAEKKNAEMAVLEKRLRDFEQRKVEVAAKQKQYDLMDVAFGSKFQTWQKKNNDLMRRYDQFLAENPVNKKEFILQDPVKVAPALVADPAKESVYCISFCARNIEISPPVIIPPGKVLRTGTLSLGHAFVVWSVDDVERGLCAAEAFGFDPKDANGLVALMSFKKPVTGWVFDEYLRNPGQGFVALTVKVKKSDYDKTLLMREEWQGKEYSLAKQDCVTFAETIAKQIGLKVPDRPALFGNIPTSIKANLPEIYINKLRELNRDREKK